MASTAFDANILIYFLENDRQFGEAARDAFAAALENGRAVISVIGAAEFFSHPHDKIMLNKFEKFAELVDIVPVDGEVAKLAGELRQLHKSIKLPDALHLATAVKHKAETFVTNDDRLFKLGTVEQTAISRLVP